MFGNSTIKNRVMQVIKAKLAKRQKEYDERCEELEGKFENEVAELQANKEAEKSNLAEQIVTEILGPLN